MNFPTSFTPPIQPQGGGKMPQVNNPFPNVGSGAPMTEKERMFLGALEGAIQGGNIHQQDGWAIYGGNSPMGAAMGMKKVYGDIDSEKRAEKQRKQERMERMEDRIKVMEMQEAANDRRAIRDAGIRSSQIAAQELLRLNAEQRQQNRMEKEVLRKEAREDKKQAEAQKLEQEATRRSLIGDIAQEVPQTMGRLHSVDPSVTNEQLEQYLGTRRGERMEMETASAQARSDALLAQAQSRVDAAAAKAAQSGVSSSEISMRKSVADSLSDMAATKSDAGNHAEAAVYDRAAILVMERGISADEALQIASQGAGGTPSPAPASGGGTGVYSPADIINQF